MRTPEREGFRHARRHTWAPPEPPPVGWADGRLTGHDQAGACTGSLSRHLWGLHSTPLGMWPGWYPGMSHGELAAVTTRDCPGPCFRPGGAGAPHRPAWAPALAPPGPAFPHTVSPQPASSLREALFPVTLASSSPPMGLGTELGSSEHPLTQAPQSHLGMATRPRRHPGPTNLHFTGAQVTLPRPPHVLSPSGVTPVPAVPPYLLGEFG